MYYIIPTVFLCAWQFLYDAVFDVIFKLSLPAHKVHLQNIIFSLALMFNISLFYINNKMVTLLKKKKKKVTGELSEEGGF